MRGKPKYTAPLKKTHSFRVAGLGPRKGRQKTGIRWAASYRKLMLAMQGAPKASRRAVRSRGTQHYQRVTVRIRYARRRAEGQWKAHGRYIERESAGAVGFDADGRSKPSAALKDWQEQRDEKIWKVIISPEFALELEPYTKELMARVEKDLGQPLIWTAAAHHSTAHNHVHLVIRGIDRDGKPVDLPRAYVKEGFRMRAQALATEILGHRLGADIAEAQSRMITQARFTDLDRTLLRQSTQGMVFVDDPVLAGRLDHLVGMGLAEKLGDHAWTLRPGMEQALRVAQQLGDVQSMIDLHGVVASDPSQAFHKTDWTTIRKIEGRVLVHGQEDNRDAAYMVLEDVNGAIHILDHRHEIQEMRRRGKMQPGSYVAMRVKFTGRKPDWIIEDYGPADAAVSDPDFVERCARRGVRPDHGFGGWLGRLRDAVSQSRSRFNSRRP